MAKSPAETKNYTAQQIDFALRYYMPNSPTYDNAYQSALAAKYSETYARSITDADVEWIKTILSDIIGKPTDKKNLVEKAKKNLDKLLGSQDERVKADITKFVAKTDVEFSEKQEVDHTGNITISTVNYSELNESNYSL